MKSIIDYNIVVLGNFNPVIFQTEWLRRYKILPEQEIVATLQEKLVAQPSPEVQVVEGLLTSISPSRTLINFPSYQLSVLPVSFKFTTTKKNCSTKLLDATIKVFELLPHTPVNAIGFNYRAHLEVNNRDLFLKELFCANSNKVKTVLGQDYAVGGKFIVDRDDHTLHLVAEHSAIIENGLFIVLNYHRKIESRRVEDLLSICRKNYVKNLEEAEVIIRTLLDLKESVFI